MNDSPPTNKSLGQHWLYDQTALQDIVTSARIGSGDAVLEIGPGPGALTQLLCQAADRVVAVEFDAALAAALPRRVPASNLTVVTRDILRFDFTQLPPDYVVVANIPYYLTSNLIRLISETPNQPKRAILLIQKEVAERVTAEPGEMSILSVTAQFYWQASLGSLVPARLFTPPPKVDSQVLVLERRPQLLFAVDTKQFFRLVKAGFSQRRKTLLNSLNAGLRLDRQVVQDVCEAADIDPVRRAQTLGLDDWYALYETLESGRKDSFPDK